VIKSLPHLPDGCGAKIKIKGFVFNFLVNEPVFKYCCIRHDKDYITKRLPRWKSDLNFLRCMLRRLDFEHALSPIKHYTRAKLKAYIYYTIVVSVGWIFYYDLLGRRK